MGATRKRSRLTAAEARMLAEIRNILSGAAGKLHETAVEIRSGKIHPAHVANRLDKLARELGYDGGTK